MERDGPGQKVKISPTMNRLRRRSLCPFWDRKRSAGQKKSQRGSKSRQRARTVEAREHLEGTREAEAGRRARQVVELGQGWRV
jgi:hypothetical protein